MNNLDVKLGLGWTLAKQRKQPITNEAIKSQAIELINKHKAMSYNIEEDHLDLYTSYFGGPGSNFNYKKQLMNEYQKRFKLGSTLTSHK